MKRTRPHPYSQYITPFVALLLSSSIPSSSGASTNLHEPPPQQHLPQSLPRILETTTSTTSQAQNGEIITMKLEGIQPLSPTDIQWFETQTQNYIEYYYNEATITNCVDCLQKYMDVESVVIQVTDQSPSFEEGSSSSGSGGSEDPATGEVKLMYTQITKYTTTEDSDSTTTNNTTMTTPTFEDIVKEPFNNIAKRQTFRDDFLKGGKDGGSSGNAPESMTDLLRTSSVVIQLPSRNFWTSIGFYAIVGTAGAVVLVGLIFGVYCCRKKSRTIDKIRDGEGYADEEHNGGGYGNHNRGVRGGDMNGNGKVPSSLDVHGKNDEISTIMVDPQGQTGIFSGKSTNGFNQERYVLIYIYMSIE